MHLLKSQKIWLCWNWVIRGGKRTKIPIAASGCTTGVDESYRCTWVTYDEAVKAAEEHGYAGVGFVIPKKYFFLDIDKRDINHPLVQMLLRRYNSYAEKSISGNGIHIYGTCDLSRLPTYTDEKGKLRLVREFYMKSPDDLELYIGGITNRFAVYTGDAVNDCDISDCTEAVLTTLDKEMRRKPKTKYSESRDGDRADFDIIADLRKAKNGEKFMTLYDRGDISGYLHSDGTPDASRADCALCAMIAFRTGPDPETIFRLVKSSALYREKWDRDDYRESTIQAGIEACNGVFHQSVMPRPYFVKFKKNNEPYISVPLLAKYTKEHIRYILVRDNGNQSVRLYVYEQGVYKLYATDMLQAVIKGYVEEYDMELVSMGQISAAANIILTDLNYVRQDELNADEGIINFQNGILRLADMALLPHSPEVLSTIQIPCEWHDSPTPTPVYDAYLSRLVNYDAEMENLCNEINGVVISNVNCSRMKKSVFFVGDGNTGKSQLKSLVEHLLGPDNYIGIDLKDIEARFGTGAIYGTRLAGSSDMSFVSIGELKAFKSLTGGDSVFAEFKGQQPFKFFYKGFLWFCMNRLPRFGGDDGQWVFDRIMIIHCENVIPESEQDKQLLDKMYAERDGIIHKAVMALKTVIENGYRFSEPQTVREARQSYMEETNTALAFFTECMEQRSGQKIADGCTTGKVFDVYRAWCTDNNNGYAKTAREFRDAISAYLGMAHSDLTVHTKKGNFYRDYTLTDAAKERYSKAYGSDFADFLS